MKLISGIFLLFSLASGGQSAVLSSIQELRIYSKSISSAKPFSVDYHADGRVRHLSGNLVEQIHGGYDLTIHDFIRKYNHLFGIQDVAGQLNRISRHEDKHNMVHLVYQQYFNGLPVFYRFMKFHFDIQGHLGSVENDYYPEITIGTAPTLSEQDAIAIAKTRVAGSPVLKSSIRLGIHTYDRELSLVYEVQLGTVNDPVALLINAHSGIVEMEYPLAAHEGPAVGYGITNLGEEIPDLNIYEGAGFIQEYSVFDALCLDWCYELGDCDGQDYSDCELNIQQGACADGYVEDCSGQCWSDEMLLYLSWGLGNDRCETEFLPVDLPEDDQYCLVDESRPDLGRIFTFSSYLTNYENVGWVTSGVDSFTFSDDSLSYRSGTEAHHGIRRCIDYFKNVHDYNGVDGNGNPVMVIVDYNGWNATYNWILDKTDYGFGGYLPGYGTTTPWSADLGIVGHEFGHGITGHSSKLVYRNLSGALNESLSDMFGYIIKNHVYGSTSWLLGEDIFIEPEGKFIRDMSNPPNGNDPDHIDHAYFHSLTDNPNDNNDNGGVHTNSGIPNKVFYLLVEGGDHYGYHIEPLDTDFDSSLALAADIVFTWDTQYLSMWDDFSTARIKMLQVVSDLYPENTDIYLCVFHTWASVGLEPDVFVSGLPEQEYFAPGSGQFDIGVDLSEFDGLESAVSLILVPLSGDIQDTLDCILDDSTGLYKTTIMIPDNETALQVDLNVLDSTGQEYIYDGLTHFTTSGPVQVSEIQFINDTIPNPGDFLVTTLGLRNEGSETVTIDVMAYLHTNDDCIEYASTNLLHYGNIDPGSMHFPQGGLFSITIADSCVQGRDAEVVVEIGSQGHYFWADTIYIPVQEQLGIPGGSLLITEFNLHPAYPNPFNPVTTLRYQLPEDAMVNITIYDMMGRQVSTLVSSQQSTGYKSVQWNGTNDAGSPVSAGLYLYRIQAGEFRQTRKMVLLQ